MKKLMILMSLLCTTQLSYAPEAERIDKSSEPNNKPKTESPTEKNQREAKEYEQSQAAKSNAPQAPTNAEAILKTTESVKPPLTPIHFDVETSPAPTVTEVSHPDQKGLFSTKKISTIITDHGDGTLSITNKEEVQGWFSNKTTSSSTKYKLDTDQAKQITNKIKNDPLGAKEILSKSKNKISSQVEVGTKKYNKDGTSVETIKSKDGKATTQVTYDKNGTPTAITDSNGQLLSKSTEVQQAKTTFIQKQNGELINSNEFQTSKKFYNEDGHPVNKDGALVDVNGSLIKPDAKGEWKNESGQRVDEYGNIQEPSSLTAKNTNSPAPQGVSSLPQIPGLTAA